MKNYRLIYFVTAAVLVLASCKNEEVGPVISDPTPPVMTAPAIGLSLEFTEANANEELDFAWSAATNYGFAAAVTYKVEMSLPGDNFANPSPLITTNELTAKLTYGALNNIMMAAELAPAVIADLQFRVAASVSEIVPSAYSNVLALSAKPYRVVVNYPKLYVPGSYQGWTPGTAPVISSLQSDGKYEGYIWFADANTNFKFTDGPSWDKNWGDDGVDGTLNPNGANIVAAEAGYYKLNVDIPKLTYTSVKTVWGIVGDATGSWDVDQVMTFDAIAGTWSKTLDLVAGNIKFRANGAWTIEFGDNKTNLSLEYGGANIPIAAAGNYTVTLDLRGPIYTYVIKKN
jgi:starch-binding outer membrane protein SusE/F